MDSRKPGRLKTVAMMPLRGGSKGFPGKNLAALAGKPLFFWALDSALESAVFASVWVSTDSVEIASQVQEQFGARVRVIDRPPELARDESSTEAVMLDFMSRVPFDTLCTIQATSPLTTALDFRAALSRFETDGLDSLLTACRFKRFLWSEDGRPLNFDYRKRPRRQDFAGGLVENGAFYLTRKALLESTGCRLGGKIGVHEMSEDSFFEVDRAEDLAAIESLAGHELRRRVRDPLLR